MGFFDNLGNALFEGGSSASDAGMEQMRKVPGVYDQYLKPWVNRGEQAYGKYNASMDEMMKNGGVDFTNNIYSQYQESPQYKFASGQATDAAANAAAAGGTLGTGAHQAQLADYIQGLSSRDQEGFYNRAMGAYGQGLQGENQLMNMGYGAGNNMAQGMAGYYGDMAGLEYNKQEAQNRGAMNTLGMGLGLAAGGLGGMGAAGAAGKSLSQGGELPTPFGGGGWSWGGAAKSIAPFFR